MEPIAMTPRNRAVKPRGAAVSFSILLLLVSGAGFGWRTRALNRGVKFGVLVLALSLLAGCAAPNRTDKTTSFSEINDRPPTTLQPNPESKADPLHRGDTIVISIVFDGPPPGIRMEPLVRRVAEDGAVELWAKGGFHIPVVGLTSTETAAKIRGEIIMKYIGVIVRGVNVRVQSHVNDFRHGNC